MAFPVKGMVCEYSNDSTCCESDYHFSVNTRVAYYHPTSKRVREIYKDGWADYQVEISSQWKENWQLWTGVSGFSEKGRSTGFDDSTKLTLIPLSLGVKYIFDEICSTKFYVGAGACYSWLTIHDHSRYVHEHTRKKAFGGIFQFGAYYNVTESIFANAFVDYLYQRFHFPSESYSPYVKRNDLNMSGFKIGVGLGMSF